jgi:hypothetical protein
MIDLSNTKPFASGGNRDCYISPINSKACIKVTKKEILKKIKKDKVWYKKFRSNESFDDNLREQTAYKQNAITSPIDNSIWDHLAKWNGMVDTSLGPASETELIKNDDEIAETLENYLFREGLTDEIKLAIESFEIWLRKHQVLTKNIIPHNIVLKKIDGVTTLKIIDGLGCSSFIPLPKYSKYFAKRYVERRISLMWSRINWDLSGRKGDWK